MANISKGVTLAMVDYSATPTFADTDILADLQNFPDFLPANSALDATTLANDMRVYVQGIKETPESLDFTFLYSGALLKKITTAEGVKKSFQIKFPDNVTFTFGGYISAGIMGKGVNEVLQLNASVTPATDITIGGLPTA